MEILPDRKLNRMKGYNYNQKGYYFVSIDIEDMKECLGQVKDGIMYLNDYGKIVEKYWLLIPKFYKNVDLDAHIVMPNHMHGIVHIIKNYIPIEGTGQSPVRIQKNNFRYGLLSKIIRAFKAEVVKEIREKHKDYNFQWKRSFHDSIVWSKKDLDKVRRYIMENPKKWAMDRRNLNKS